jgi:CelD/BcsL family acetyltransferase involved in cellulose biosynthesis
MTRGAITTRVLSGFEDPAFGPDRWERLLEVSKTRSVYLTWHYQRAWWETFKRGELLLILAQRKNEAVALAPFYAQSGMIYFLASDFESDRLDFVGNLDEAEVLEALLKAARDHVPDFQGFRFYFVPDSSDTGKLLCRAAERLGLRCYEEEDMLQPTLDLAGKPEAAQTAIRKKSLVRHEHFFRREGNLEVQHYRDGEAILPQLDQYFAQHIKRWEGTDNPSRYTYFKARLLVERLTQIAAKTGWLRFTTLKWNGCPIAFHYGFCYGGRYIRGTPSFSIDLARHRPGEVLLRQTLIAALEEGAHTFDFRTGDHHFKLRFATDVEHLRTWGIYPTGRRSILTEGPVASSLRATD